MQEKWVESAKGVFGCPQNKSLCVLNQKDKFTTEQIEQTTQYVKRAFKEFFSDVIPISARQALEESRSHDKSDDGWELGSVYARIYM